jgi:hypothetical protein
MRFFQEILAEVLRIVTFQRAWQCPREWRAWDDQSMQGEDGLGRPNRDGWPRPRR